jgi:hypothetical protein
MTEKAPRVFKEMNHPDGGFACPYCKDSPVFEWWHRVPREQVTAHIREYSMIDGEISEINGLDKDGVGHAAQVEVKYTNNKRWVYQDANKFRTVILRDGDVQYRDKDGQWHNWLDNAKHHEIIMSTSFEMKIEGDGGPGKELHRDSGVLLSRGADFRRVSPGAEHGAIALRFQ